MPRLFDSPCPPSAGALVGQRLLSVLPVAPPRTERLGVGHCVGVET